MHLRDHLQQTLGTAYTIVRELGGGGMSRVFIARDESLRRNVVVKVLPPDLVAGVNADRFDREIQFCAGLQHPHIVPLLSAGQSNGVPYYTMPFVEGDSLRARLAQHAQLPMTEAIGILRDVAKALAYAHDRGIVHRDIKPDNVLLSGGSAMVTDFGIAKAISASLTVAPDDTLTQIGTSLGTPAYMAPEQAAADPATDHRADIYSFGCLAYEMLAGRPLFVGKTPQKLLAAQMGEAPQPLSELRRDTPRALASLLMACLEKDPGERPQRAIDIVHMLETVTSDDGHESAAIALSGSRGMLERALLVYVTAFIVVAIVAKAAIVVIGLPDWVLPGVLLVMVLGLPMILFTAYVQGPTRRAFAKTPTYSPRTACGIVATLALIARPHVSWRRTAVAGAMAVSSFILLIGGYMLLRALGIGPAGSLLAAGTLAPDEKLLVSDFPNPPGDSTLGITVTEAFRTALGQSGSVMVLQQNQMRDVLQRMRRPATAHVDYALAREIASREGIRAVVDGNLIAVGGKYLLAVRLMSPQSGEELAKFSETAAGPSELLGTIDKLAKRVRGKVGESLRKVQRTPPLEQVTTPSLDALRKYVQGSRAYAMEGNFTKGVALMEEAVALDTGFAMAYRKLAVAYSNRGLTDRSALLLEKAFAHRERLSDAERYLVVGSYYQNGAHQNAEKAQAAYEQLLDIQPTNPAGLNNLGLIYHFTHEYVKAEAAYFAAIRFGRASPHYGNLAATQLRMGKLADALQTAAAFHATFPSNEEASFVKAEVEWNMGQYDSSAAILLAASSRKLDDELRARVLFALADYEKLHGRLREADRLLHEAMLMYARSGFSGAPIAEAVSRAEWRASFLDDRRGALRIMDDTLSNHPLGRLVPTHEFAQAARVYALAGKPDAARAVFAQWQEVRKSRSEMGDTAAALEMKGDMAMGTVRYGEAIAAYRAANAFGCETCDLPKIGRAFDLSGEPDSAIALFSHYLAASDPDRMYTDGMALAGVHERLGELYEAGGNRADALSHYNTFLGLWKNADPELQPKVQEVRQRVALLSKLGRMPQVESKSGPFGSLGTTTDPGRAPHTANTPRHRSSH